MNTISENKPGESTMNTNNNTPEHQAEMNQSATEPQTLNPKTEEGSSEMQNTVAATQDGENVKTKTRSKSQSRKIKASRAAKEARLAQESMMEMIDHQALEMMRAILENQVSKKYGDAVVDLFKAVDKEVTYWMSSPTYKCSKYDEEAYDFFYRNAIRMCFSNISNNLSRIELKEICECFKSAMAALQEVNLDGWRLVRYSDFNGRVVQGRSIDDEESTTLYKDSIVLGHLFQFQEMRQFLRVKSGDFFAVYNNGRKLSKVYRKMLAQNEHDSEDAA